MISDKLIQPAKEVLIDHDQESLMTALSNVSLFQHTFLDGWIQEHKSDVREEGNQHVNAMKLVLYLLYSP